MKLWLIRHAQVLLGKGICYGVSDVPADGAQTLTAARTIAQVLPTRLPMVVSALGRAQQLAQALMSMRPDLLSATTDPRLNEMDFGQWELRRWDDIPRKAFDAWMNNFAHERFGGRESTQQVIDRVADALDAQRFGAEREVIWITHAGVIRAVQYIAARGRQQISNANEWSQTAPDPGAWCCVDISS